MKQMIENHVNLSVNARMHAPVIVLPDTSDKSDCSLLANLGLLSLDTEEPQPDQEMYDIYRIKLSNLFIFNVSNSLQIGDTF